jgi:hypothetical protein
MKLANERWGCFFAALAFGILSLLAGVGSLYYVIVGPLLSMRAAADWAEVPCIIRESSVEHHTGGRVGDTDKGFYSIRVKYDYRYKGQEYTSERYDLYDISTGEVEWKKAVVKKIPPGTETICFVNPDNPSEAVLSRARNVGYVTAIPGVLFLLLGLFCVYLLIFGRLLPRRGPPSNGDEIEDST